MRRIQVPQIAYADRDVTLNGVTYTLTFRYNERDGDWRMDIKDTEGNVLKNGIALIESSGLTTHLSGLDQIGGLIFTSKIKGGDDRLGRDNVGVGKTHELIFAPDGGL